VRQFRRGGAGAVRPPRRLPAFPRHACKFAPTQMQSRSTPRLWALQILGYARSLATLEHSDRKGRIHDPHSVMTANAR